MATRLPARLLVALTVVFLAACAPESSSTGVGRVDAAGTGPAAEGADPRAAASVAGIVATGAGLPAALPFARSGDAIAAYPDRGDLVGYNRVLSLQRRGGHTYHAVQVSEAHALAAIGGRPLTMTGPDGRQVRLQYERHVEHSSGDWSWIGRDEHGIEGILTFGEKAVFGVLPYGENESLRLTTNGGQAWMALATPGVLSPLQQRIRDGLLAPDYRVPPPGGRGGVEAAAASIMAAAAPATTAAAPVQPAGTAGTTIDVLLGYTPGFASMLGGTSQAQTRLNHLITVGNQAFANSSVSVNLRLVATLQVNHADTGSNEVALEQLTGSDGQSDVPVPASLQPLRNARETRGADLVALIRRFRDPEHEGCGIAWLIGGGQNPITAGYERFGYSVVSDSNGMQAPDNGHFCRDENLVHEIGHNMGSQHDLAAAQGDNGTLEPEEYGRYPYSFGLKTTTSNGNFYTVMAYGDTGQTAWRIFSNPQSTYCGGRACGIANQADNARSLRDTAPLIAAFRQGTPVRPNLFAIRRNGTNSTEVHILGGANHYASFVRQLPTALGKTGSGYGWAFRTGDYNRDGVVDLYAISKNGASGNTEVHVLNGATNYSTFNLHVATLIGANLGNLWMFDLGHYNNDGIPDLYAIKKIGTSGRTEVHVLNGATNYRSFLLQTSTALGNTGNDLSWKFEVGDYNGDGVADLYGIRRIGTSGRTEVHILNGANRFQSFLLQRSTALGSTGNNDGWDFKLGDYDGDGQLDLYVISKNAPQATQVHVLSGASRFQSYLTNRNTALGPTGIDGAWQFDLVGP